MIAKLIWTLYLFIEVYPVQNFGIQSFCIAKSVSVGETAIISCHFSEDLSKPPEKDVNVYLYKVPGNKMEPDMVLYYAWINGNPRIKKKPGYDLQSTLTDHLIVAIYNVTKEYAGDYQCLAVGYPANLCTLNVTQDFEMPNTTTPMSYTGYTEIHPSSGSTSRGNNSKPGNIGSAESGISNYTTAIACSSIAIILAGSLSGIIIVAIKKRWIYKPGRRSVIIKNNETNGQCVTFIKQNGSSSNPQLRTDEHDKETTHSNEISCLIPSETTDPNH